MTIASPCINVCRMNPRTQWCEGCFRTLEEITQWATADDAYKQRVWMALAQRRTSIFPSDGDKPGNIPQCERMTPGSP